MSWNRVEADVNSGPLGLFKWFVVLMFSLFLVFGVLNSLGLVGGKAVERIAFKNSFQYKEGMEQRGAILEANLIEVDVLLQQNPSDPNLLAQKRVLTAQLRAITINE